MKYNIIDWTGRKLFKSKEFNSTEDGWDYIINNVKSEDHEEVFVVKSEEEGLK